MNALQTILGNPIVRKLALNKLISYLKEENAEGVELRLAPPGSELPFTYELTGTIDIKEPSLQVGYFILLGISPSGLAAIVNNAIEQGAILVGGLACNNGTFAQALYKAPTPQQNQN